MVCIYCGSSTQIINSRLQKRNNHIWRRRQCVICKAVFTTSERPDYALGWVVKSSTFGTITPLNRDKLFVSIYTSCQHRPDSLINATGLCDTVLSQIAPKIVNGTILLSDLRGLIVTMLERFDTVARVHYEAFHPLEHL
jgi:transcriptional repressor NrdR